MPFTINSELLTQARLLLSGRKRLYWVVGGAGAGKTTICHFLSTRYGIPVYDMDAHIYGAYHSRFTQDRHPINKAWSTASDGLAWLLNMSWNEFDNFNRAALPEYLDLLAEDLETSDPDASLLIDGGICNPTLIAQVISPRQIVGLSVPTQSSVEIWQESDERRSMKEMIDQLPEPGQAWLKFLEFDQRITHTILQECEESHIVVCSRGEMESVGEFAQRVARVLGI